MGRNKKTVGFFEYKKEELVDIIKGVRIEVGNHYTKKSPTNKTLDYYEINTYFNDVLTETAEVSGRYEKFDFQSFALDVLDKITSVFNIKKYTYNIVGGVQEIRLFSDSVHVNGREYVKTFYILNSSNRKHILNIDYGLYCVGSDYHFISKLHSTNKRHYQGISQYVGENTIIKDGSVFDEQIELLKSLGENSMMFSHIRAIVLNKPILDINNDVENLNVSFGDVKSVSNHVKFDIFKRKLVELYDSKKYIAPSNSPITRSLLMENSINMENIDWGKYDISFNCLDAFEKYVSIYATRVSAVIKRESEVFLNASELYLRAEKLRYIMEQIESENN